MRSREPAMLNPQMTQMTQICSLLPECVILSEAKDLLSKSICVICVICG